MKSKKKLITIISIVVLIAALPSGWYLYEQKKEKDYQALIHMGDSLQKSMDDYDETVKKIKVKKSLSEEYTHIMVSILDGKVPAEDLEETTKRACEMEKELMDTYPTVYTEPSSVCLDEK